MMYATQTYVNIAPTAASLRFMPLAEFHGSCTSHYPTIPFERQDPK